MRDIKRIKRILNKIDVLWQENPDLRLCQLIYKILGESKYLSDNDWFYVEDDYLESLINVEHSQGDWIQYEDVGKLQAENARLKEELSQVKELLKKAVNHLDYCGFGDAWERECSEGLQKELKKWEEEQGFDSLGTF